MMNALSKLTGKTISSATEVILQGFTGSADSSMTGNLIKVSTVYSISEGTVLDVSRDTDNLYVVTVQYSPTDLFRYCRLSSVNVSTNSYVIPTDEIGVTVDGKLRFEYCTNESSLYPVRIANNTYYKQDPSPILMDIRTLYMSQTALGEFFTKNANKYTANIVKTSSIPSGLSSILGGTYGNN